MERREETQLVNWMKFHVASSRTIGMVANLYLKKIPSINEVLHVLEGIL